MNDTALSILHHGRDRDKLLPRMNRWCQGASFTEMFSQANEFALQAYRLLTPPDDTRVDAETIKPYINEKFIDDDQFLYSYKSVVVAMERVMATQERTGDPEDWAWLAHRGVTYEQMKEFRHFNSVETGHDRIALGITIHLALADWITGCPTGFIYPAYDFNGRLVGNHLRFLSTVPKIKFGSACPQLFVSHNIKPGSVVKRLWLVEGVFDGLAVDKCGEFYMSPSSGNWSAEQMWTLMAWMRRHPEVEVALAHDSDRVGVKENLLLFSVLSRMGYKTKIYCYPSGAKDIAEVVNKLNVPLEPTWVDPEAYAEIYLKMPYKRIISFNHYLDHRNTAYSNSRYHWQ